MSALRASPFPTVTRKKQDVDGIDPAMLRVEHDTEPPRFRSRETYKYDPVFGKLKPGSSIVCEPSEVNTLASALRKGIETKRYAALIGCKVISLRCCPDGSGRVWAMSPKGALRV